MDVSDTEAKHDLLTVASRHPNSKVAKLINDYLIDNSSTTLVLLLEELEKNVEYATDFIISIDFFLKCIERDLESSSFQFSEIGRKLMAAARIWAKRVEDVHSRVESQSLGLSSNSEQTKTPVSETGDPSDSMTASTVVSVVPAKPKSRKRPIHDDINELKMEVKSFKRVTANKLFAHCEDRDNPQMLPHYFTEEHINPTLYKSCFVVDPDNDDNVDCKANYKIFHYHIEHRYNTPVSDYNFRLHFAIKDYMNIEDIDDVSDEIDELVATDDEHCLPSWAPQQYLEKAIGLENQAFEGQLSVMDIRKRKSDTVVDDPVEKQRRLSLDISNIHHDPKALKSLTSQDSGISDNSQPLIDGIVPMEEESLPQEIPNEIIENDISFNPDNHGANSSKIANDYNMENNAANNSERVEDGINNNSSLPDFNQSSLLDSTNLIQEQYPTVLTDLGFAETDKVLPEVVMTTDKLSQSDDEGIVLSDQEESYRQTPTENIEQENQRENVNDAPNNNVDIICSVPVVVEEDLHIKYPLNINIFGLKESVLRRQAAFKLPIDLNCIHQERLLKSKTVKKPNETKKQQMEAAKATSQLNKYNRMGAPDSLFSFTHISESMNDEGNESENEDGDFIGFNISTTKWSNGQLVFPKDGFDEIPQVREASEANDDTHIINDQSFIERGSETAEQSVLESEQCMPNATNNQDLTDEIIKDFATIYIGSPRKEQELSSDEIINAPELLKVPEINFNDTSMVDHDDKNLDSTFEETFMESEGDDENSEQHLCAESEQRIREWHRKITPVLAEAHQRQHFSIFDIGTNIINKVSNGADTMDKITADEDPFDLSKNFLSLLILTNQGNVELDCGERNYNEPTDVSKLKVKLLSTKRHEVHIEDDIGAGNIMAPSPKKRAIDPKTTVAPATPSASLVTSTIASTSTAMTSNTKICEIQQMVRTLKPIPKAKNTDDNDSGVGSFISQNSIS